MAKYKNIHHRLSINWLLVVYDAVVFAICTLCCYFFPSFIINKDITALVLYPIIMFFSILVFRFLFKVYHRIWRYEGVSGYLSIVVADLCGLAVFIIIEELLPIERGFAFTYVVIALVDLLAVLVIRFIYRYIFKYGWQTKYFKFFNKLMKLVTLGRVDLHKDQRKNLVNIAIVGAGRTGQALAYDLQNNPASYYQPLMFIDIDKSKIGKRLLNIPVYADDSSVFNLFDDLKIKEVVIAIPDLTEDERAKLFRVYKKSGCRVKVYDYATTISAGAKPKMRDFDIEDLMPRNQVDLSDSKLADYYKGKSVLITGGGGSIGSEIARQVFAMNPAKLILLDIYENGAYDVTQELINLDAEKGKNIYVEICSVTSKPALTRAFEKYRPDIVIHAAAHKHVPLMEDNAVEAIYNNIFGTKYLIEVCEDFKVERFMLVSTDKAVNPTNVMGATKRFCEMMLQYESQKPAQDRGGVIFASTRFGNVLGSAGSVVPLFKRQIEAGGPITVTDKRITRYFMTIPEACSLVLEASLMSKNGELFVLDMGRPVKIYELAKNMIEISGNDIDIVEIGLRPGEKLFEEILFDETKNSRTENKLIYIEKEDSFGAVSDVIVSYEQLREVVRAGDNEGAKSLLMQVIPEYKTAEEVNKNATAKLS